MSSDQKNHQGVADVSSQQQQPQQNEQEHHYSTGDINNPMDQPKKAKRKRITPEQLEDLVGLFEKTDTPSFEIRESLAKKLGMTNREIQVWFQNRRAKANRIKINEQAALQHQQHLQQQQQLHQQQLGHHYSHHRSSSANGFTGSHPSLVHSAPSTPLQSLAGHHPHHHHHHPHHGGSNGPSSGSGNMQGHDSAPSTSSFAYFGSNGSSSPPMSMSTPTPRAHPSLPNRRPVSLYDVSGRGFQQYQQHQPQKSGQFSSIQHSSSTSSAFGSHHGQSHSSSTSSSPYGMDIILPANSTSSTTSSATSSTTSSQRPFLPPPISTLGHNPHEDYEDSRRTHRHERTLSEGGYPQDYMSPTSVSPISPPPERHIDTHQYREEHDEDSPTSVTHSSFPNGGNNGSSNNINNSSTTNGTNPNRHSASFSSFGGSKPLARERTEETEPAVVAREKSASSSSAYYNNPGQAAKNRRSYDEEMYEDQMRDSFNMESRLVISEEETRPESAIDILAYAAAFIQESEEHKKDNNGNSNQISKDGEGEKRDGLGQLNSNKRQSFHGPSGYPSKEPFQEDPSSRYSSNSMTWEASPPGGGNSSGGEVMPVPRRRGGDDGPYAPRRPRPVTYSGSGFLYDHQESQFLPQTSSPSFGSYNRTPSSSNSSARRMNNRNSTEVGSGGLFGQRVSGSSSSSSLGGGFNFTRPRRSSSTATTGLPNSHLSNPPVLPPILGDNPNRLLSPAMVPSPQFGARLARQDSQGSGINMNGTRDSPGSDSYSHTSRDNDMEDIEEESRAAKRRSGSFFGVGVGSK
ncbi:hypothetical protein BGZ76_002796 [Entomortierella beljakovae]|nr:hypothetical protein BGZ76_002796 [Entomortierella beljakovae]